MVRKACFKCGVEKLLTDFYAHKAMADGRLGKCKECAKADTRAARQQNLERHREYDRMRSRQPHRIALSKKAKPNHNRKPWQIKNPEKRAAHIVVGHAIRDGKLLPKPCERCGSEKRVHAHHEDYSKPLAVVWLCSTCHGARHREINQAARFQDPHP